MKRYDLVVEDCEYCLQQVFKDGKWGVRNPEESKEIIAPQYDEICILRHDLFAVKAGDLSFVINDKNEKIYTVKEEYNYISLAEEDYILIEGTSSMQYVSLDGKASKIYDEIQYFGDSSYVIIKKDKHYGLMDRDLTEVISPKYDLIVHVKDTSYFAQQNEKLFIIDLKTKKEKALDYSFDSKHYDTHFIVKKNNLFGVIDKDLSFVIPIKYSYLDSYNRSGFRVRLPGDDESLQRLCFLETPNIESKLYNSISPVFSDLFSAKGPNGKRALFNLKYEQLTEYKYDEIRSGHANTIFVTIFKDPKGTQVYRGIIDKDGKELLPPIYDGIAHHYEGYSVELNGKCAIFDSNFKCVSKFIYDNVTEIIEDCKVGRHANVKIDHVKGTFYW